MTLTIKQTAQTAALVLFAVLILAPADAGALPMFARRIGRNCTFCHSVFPKLNETGRTFRSNGYRFEGEEWKGVKDWETPPVSFEVDIEGSYDRLKSSGLETEASDAKIEEVEISAGGPMGKTGKVSAIAMLVVEQTGSGFETRLHRAFVQVNDLAGKTGEGVLNARAGQWDVGLSFLNPATGTAIGNRYMAESALGVLSSSQRAVEINGSLVTTDEESWLPTHRYSLGISRENVNDDNKLSGYYATCSATIKETFNFGIIWRGGREADGAVDRDYRKFGIAGEAEAGPFIFTAAFFRSMRSGRAGLGNYLGEVAYFPMHRVVLAARYDAVSESGRDRAVSKTLLARYNILVNVHTSLEYRVLEDKDLVTGANEDESRLRLSLSAVF